MLDFSTFFGGNESHADDITFHFFIHIRLREITQKRHQPTSHLALDIETPNAMTCHSENYRV